MPQLHTIYGKQERAIGLAAALLLHAVILYALWSYHIIPPPGEALTVFVNCVNPAAPRRTPPPAVEKPPVPPVRQETPAPVVQTAPKVLTSTAPVLSPAEPVAPPPPVVKVPPAPVPVSAPVVSRPAEVPRPAPAAPPQPVQLGSELSVACPDRTPPVYPKQSLRQGEQGRTVLLVELNELGRVTNVTVNVTSGFPRLDEAAAQAVRTWRCTPAKRNGSPVRAMALQPFNFNLPKGR